LNNTKDVGGIVLEPIMVHKYIIIRSYKHGSGPNKSNSA
jgi:hypothetical protein